MNAATAIITTKSPYMARISFTVPQVNETLGTWAYKSGIKKVYTMVSDFGPGHDGEAAFHGLQGAGGEIVGAVRYPVANQDFSAFIQRAKDISPEAIYIWSTGRRAAGGDRQGAGRARHRSRSGRKCWARARLTSEEALKSMGDAAHRHHHRAALRLQPRVRSQQGVRQSTRELNKRNPDIFSAGAYDGMHLIYEALKKTAGKTDGDALVAAAKGCVGEPARADVDRPGHPRHGADRSTSGGSRRSADEVRNVEFDKVENVKDPFKARMKN